MKTVTLNIDETLYDTLLAMLQGLPKQKIEIIEQEEISDINQFAGSISSFAAITDPVQWQNELRSEWERN
jgi:hypothetical protein